MTRARHAAGDYAETLGADRGEIETFVSEAVGNAVSHAFRRKEGGGRIRLTVQRALASRRLLVSVHDDGVGIRPHPGRQGLGLGLPIMAAMASSLEIERLPGGGTHVRGFFPLRSARRSGEDRARRVTD